MVLVCGTDEAGRGPMIGPLALAGVLVKEENKQKLVDLGVKDSKLLTPEKRLFLSEKILEIVEDHIVLLVPPEEIDAALNNPGTNLNWLEADKTAEIANSLKCQRLIVDCPSPNLQAFSEYIINLLEDKSIEMVCEHKADLNHIESAAASILAKVARDKEIEKLKREIGVDFGSGYPADPKTKAFLLNNWQKHSNIFRKTWASYKKVADANQKSLSEF